MRSDAKLARCGAFRRALGQYLTTPRAREYDPDTGRFLEVDPKEAEAGEPDLSSYLYAEDDPTLLTDPSGLDPRFGNATLNCKRNKLLCSFIYGAGYKDGARGYLVRKAFAYLSQNGIMFSHALGAAQNKGKVVNSTFGPDGPGLYFVGGGQSRRIRPPGDASCGWRCSFGFSITQVFGCGTLRARESLHRGARECRGESGHNIGSNACTGPVQQRSRRPVRAARRPDRAGGRRQLSHQRLPPRGEADP